MNNYACPRCGLSTDNKQHFTRHLNRKYKCKPRLQNIEIDEIAREFAIIIEEYPKYEKISQIMIFFFQILRRGH